MDKEMKELMEALGAAIVPRRKRKAYYHTSWRTPYYRDERYRRV